MSTDFEAWIYIIYKKRKRRRIGSVFVLPYVVGRMSARMRENSFVLANVFLFLFLDSTVHQIYFPAMGFFFRFLEVVFFLEISAAADVNACFFLALLSPAVAPK